jgi:hypothetical protein
VGLGGVFQFPKPEKVDEIYGGSLYKMFFVGPAVAKAMVRLGNPEKPFATIGGGMFPYKYNPDAVNLGDYLFRSTPYPTTIFTGGLLFVNENAAYLEGFQGNFRLGGLNLDLLFTTETSMPPLYDWSLGMVASYSLAGGIVEIGAGVNLKRLLKIKPERTSPDSISNSYFTRSGVTYTGNAGFYSSQLNFLKSQDSLIKLNPQWLTDSAALQVLLDSVNAFNTPGGPSFVPAGSRSYYTTAGTVAMARMAIDFGKMLDMPSTYGPFRIFGEIGILGWKDYPIFYEKKAERMPIMLGIHVPTMGLLQQLTVQFEQFKSPWANNTENLGVNNYPIPVFPDGYLREFSGDSYNEVTQHDDIAWSILLKRKILSHLTLDAQFARDHMRTVGTDWFYGGRYEPGEVLYRNSSWYWMVQFSWGI